VRYGNNGLEAKLGTFIVRENINTSENEIFENNSYLQRRNTVPTG
jgi:hypothetical protein